MSAVEVDLIDGALWVDPAQIPAAIAAMENALEAAAGTGRDILIELGFTLTVDDVNFAVTDFRGVLDGPADAALHALAPYAKDYSALHWEDDNGVRWRYIFQGGKLIEQVPGKLWRDVDDRTRRCGDVLAPLVIRRSPELFEQWWKESRRAADITESLAMLELLSETPQCLHSLVLEIFQTDPSGAMWLQVDGLGRGVGVDYVMLDIDPSFDPDGVADGVTVVLSLRAICADEQTFWVQVPVYVDKPHRALLPATFDDPAAAVASVVDAALALVNSEIAERDKFTFGARDVMEP